MTQERRLTSTQLLTLLPVLLVFGCASPTPYQPEGMNGGYSAERIDSNTYQVTFRGNYATPEKTAIHYTLRRAAELALANNKPYIQVINAASDVRQLQINKPPHLRQIMTTSNGLYTFVDEEDDLQEKHAKPVVVMTVQFLDTPTGGQRTFSAQALLETLQSN